MTLGRRLFAWTVAMIGGQIVAIVVLLRYDVDPSLATRLAIGSAIGVGLGVVGEMFASQQSPAFDAVARGDWDACGRMLAERRRDDWLSTVDVFGSAALACTEGVSDETRDWVAKQSKRGLAGRLRTCIEAQIDLASTDPRAQREALARVAALPPFGVVPGRERFRALLVATGAARLGESGRDAIPPASLASLERSSDVDVRAFGAWIRASFDAPIGANERPHEARRGAELARAHRFDELAAKLDTRAATIERASASMGPYRR